MNRLKEYHIQFVALELGSHQFEFDINDSFFEHFEFSQVHRGDVHVEVSLEKMERMMIFNISLTGKVLVTCDRCTNEFYFSLSDSQKLIVKLGAEYLEESDDVIVIPDTEHKFDLSPYIYEFIHLALPVRLLHPDDEHGNSTCDPDMLQLLQKLTPTGTTDSRWEELKKLNN